MSSLDVTPISIGGRTITQADFCAALRQRNLHQYQSLVDRVADYHLLLAACDRLGISTTTEELQEEADNWRRSNDLLSASDTRSWLGYKNLSADDLEKSAEFRILTRKLLQKEHGPGAVKERFERDVHRYTGAALSILAVGSKEKCEELAKQLNEEKRSFAHLARKHSIEPATAAAGGMLGWTTLADIPEDARDPVLQSAGRGEIVGPIESGGVWHLIQVAALEKPAFGPEFEKVVMAELLDEWLAAERKRTKVEYPQA